jgi:hypothetical protein
MKSDSILVLLRISISSVFNRFNLLSNVTKNGSVGAKLFCMNFKYSRFGNCWVSWHGSLKRDVFQKFDTVQSNDGVS